MIYFIYNKKNVFHLLRILQGKNIICILIKLSRNIKIFILYVVLQEKHFKIFPLTIANSGKSNNLKHTKENMKLFLYFPSNFFR